jgi:hypothetical protein
MNGRFSDQFARSGPTGVHPSRPFVTAVVKASLNVDIEEIELDPVVPLY